jgi:hypothetical protein
MAFATPGNDVNGRKVGGARSKESRPLLSGDDKIVGRRSRGAVAVAGHDTLRWVVQSEIVPRLVMARKPARRTASRSGRGAPKPPDIAAFTQLVLGRDPNDAKLALDAMRRDGMSVEALYLDLLCPVARNVRYLWADDLCDGAALTIALSRLQLLVRELSPVFQKEVVVRPDTRAALLVPSPAERIPFELSVTEEFFRRASWTIWPAFAPREVAAAHLAVANLAAIVRAEWCDVVCFWTDGLYGLRDLAAGIRAVSRASRNPAIGVIVSGQAFTDDPDLGRRVGAHAVASDGRQAVTVAHDLLRYIS